MVVKIFFAFGLVLLFSACFGVDLDELKSQLPAELNFSNKNISAEDLKKAVREKCKKVVGEDKAEEAYLEIEAGATQLMECVSELVNTTAVSLEIEQASPKGELDIVFNKYCKKRPEALDCIGNFTGKIETCLDKEEKEQNNIIMKIAKSLLDFVCNKGGDHIALFIAEKGPECLEKSKDQIQDCINDTMSQYLPKNDFNLDINSLPQFILGPKQCKEIEKVEKCIVGALEKCEEITPANIVESMFRFIKSEAICKDGVQKSSSSSLSKVTIAIVGFSSLFLILKTLI